MMKPTNTSIQSNLFSKRAAVLAAGLLLSFAPLAPAQDSTAILNALVRKGVLTQAEAEEIRAEAKEASAAVPVPAVPAAKSVTRLSLGGRLQGQFAGISTDIAGADDPAATQHFLLRRVYLTAKASLGSDWSATMTYDFAGGFFDAAFVQWKQPDFSIDAGLRKVNLGFEERLSSGSLKAIERSGVTRYFVEDNNGRRLGGGGYRVGLFFDGQKDNFFYGAAVTNPERAVSFSSAASAGSASTNQPALWANAGYNGKFDGGTYVVGGGIGFLPDQGGRASSAPFGVGTGHDLTVYSVYTDITVGAFGLAAEYLRADVERGRSPTQNAIPQGFWIQPSYKFTEAFEGVFRYSFLDSDGRGVNLSDGVRSAPGGGTMDQLTELYAGGNWYIKGNDLKLQAGFVYGKSEDTITGGPAEAESKGVRSQLQLNF